jgi:hypothetical protein
MLVALLFMLRLNRLMMQSGLNNIRGWLIHDRLQGLLHGYGHVVVLLGLSL